MIFANPHKILIGREPEIEILEKLLHSGRPEFLAVYGRRRVGKTFLIRNYLKDKIVFDFTGSKDTKTEIQLSNFLDEYLNRIKSKRKTGSLGSWNEAFKLLTVYLNKFQNRKTKVVVFIDEMPWLDIVRSGFVPALEYFWNKHVSNMDNVLLIACGSATSWIRKKLINARGGLHNRITQRIKLMPFNLHETELFLHARGIKLSRYQILELYMAMGGIPFYLNEIVKGKSAMQQIDAICFSPQGLLTEEYVQLYHSLFKNAERHINIIHALASKPQGMTRNNIALRTQISEGSLSRTLEELVDCDFISIYQPFINKKKESIYKLTDLYSLFYLKFIKPNKRGGKGTWEKLSVKNTFTAWSGYAFENICMMHVQQIKSALGISGIYSKVSSWMYKGSDDLPGAQIDMIIDRADQTVNLCDAKFTRENFVMTKTYAAQLRMQKTIFKQATKSKKTVNTILITSHPSVKNKYYLEEIDGEITTEQLFKKV